VKTPDKNAKADGSRQKKQYLALGGLSAVLVAVIAIQFGSGGDAATPAASAMTEPAAPVPEDGTVDDTASTTPPPVPAAADNPVLSQPVPETKLARSPFSNFWSTAPAGTPAAAVAIAAPAPTITLNATMPREAAGLAVIDGQLRFQGDSIQGWLLAEVRPRAVRLQATTGESVVVEMPLIVGRVTVPVLAPPAASLAPAAPGSLEDPAAPGAPVDPATPADG